MEENEATICDLCEAESDEGSMKYAHKPYLFHFYHSQQYNDALKEFLEKRVREERSSVNEGTVDDDEDESNGEEDEEEEEEDDDMVVVGSDGEENNLFDIQEDILGESQDENATGEEEEGGEEGEDEDGEEEGVEANDVDEEEYEEEEEERDELDFTDNVTDEEIAEKQQNNYIIPTSLLTPVVLDVNKIMCQTIDVTMAAGVGIMAGIVSMTKDISVPTNSPPAPSLSIESITKTCIGTALAGIGMVSGVREILNAVNEKAPDLPICEYCNDYETHQPGCKAFCEICGDCDKGSYWRNGVENVHCLRICRNCYTNCVLCEQQVATIKTHHKAFTIKTHGKLSTRLEGTFRDARVFGSSLIIAGILTCMVPGISWAWGVGLVAGSVIANSGIRIIAKPVVKIHCESCDLVEEADKFGRTSGCQTWCQCCGVREDKGGKKYCLALCEACYDD